MMQSWKPPRSSAVGEREAAEVQSCWVISAACSYSVRGPGLAQELRAARPTLYPGHNSFIYSGVRVTPKHGFCVIRRKHLVG